MPTIFSEYKSSQTPFIFGKSIPLLGFFHIINLLLKILPFFVFYINFDNSDNFIPRLNIQ